MSNLWKTPEVESWCRGFGYEDYRRTYKEMMGDEKHLLTCNEYYAVCKFFDKVQRRDQDD